MKNKIIFALTVISSFNMFAVVSNAELVRRIDLLNEELQQVKTHRIGSLAESKKEDAGVATQQGLGRAASKVYNISKGVSIGGYGEVNYTNFRGHDESGTSVNKNPQTEVLRNIIYLGYKFNEKWVFNSEIELEHVNEVFVEFAYLDRIINENVNLRAGLILVPVGFLNLYHEPTTYLSVNRPEVEKYIIPSTWRENGLGVYGRFGKLNYQAYVVNGLNGDKFSDSGIRSGRKKGGANSEKDADTYAITARLDYNITNTSAIGASFYTGESTSTANSEDIGTALFEAHAQWKYKGFYGRALYAQAQLSNIGGINAGGANAAEQMSGYYFELGYNLFHKKLVESLTPFIRYENYNTQETVSSGIVANPSKDRENITLGLAYQPHDQIIFKADYMIKKNEAKTGVDEFHASLGYMF